MPFLPPNYERQSTEGIYLHIFTLEKWKQNLLQGIISISSHLKENNTTITQNLLLSWFQYLSTAAKNVHVHETHTHLTALFLGQPGVSWYEKVRPIWILLKQETVSGSGISWAICKSAPHFRQITMPATHHSVFYRPDALPAAQPTASKHWRPTSNLELTGLIPGHAAVNNVMQSFY